MYTTTFGDLAASRKADQDIRAILWSDSLGGWADIWWIGRQWAWQYLKEKEMVFLV